MIQQKNILMSRLKATTNLCRCQFSRLSTCFACYAEKQLQCMHGKSWDISEMLRKKLSCLETAEMLRNRWVAEKLKCLCVQPKSWDTAERLRHSWKAETKLKTWDIAKKLRHNWKSETQELKNICKAGDAQWAQDPQKYQTQRKLLEIRWPKYWHIFSRQ